MNNDKILPGRITQLTTFTNEEQRIMRAAEASATFRPDPQDARVNTINKLREQVRVLRAALECWPMNACAKQIATSSGHGTCTTENPCIMCQSRAALRNVIHG
jgi:hypothetical protein